MKNTHTITREVYNFFAERISAKMVGKHYLSEVFKYDDGEVVHRLELSLMIYREAGSGELIDIGDVWWDCTTIEFDEDGEPVLKINDFDYKELYRIIMGV